ncbi:MAG: tyrosine--tRNA ligase, partial [Candidatus Levybacteria bacterium]|nr:tyrosine--tRNA ligase [Candidatus Levybacteria bacterium]
MDEIEALLTRGVEKIYPSKEELEKILRSGKKLKLYQGFDPTGTQLHIGHMIGLRKLKQWQDLGHHVIFLIGDFTAMIGDPSGKLSSRKMLTSEEVRHNATLYKEQAGKILRFEGKNSIEIRFNSEWLSKMSGLEFLQIAGLLSVQQVVERDLFQERQKRSQDIYMNEFLYPVLQAYDCVVMDVDMEIGGSDQMFNMLMGRKLMRHMKKKEKFVMTTSLLTDSAGVKIGKTEGNIIALADKPEDLFTNIMALGDDVIIKGLEYLTDVSSEEIKTIENKIKTGENPLSYKKKLAFEVVKQLNDASAAQKAQDEFERVIQKHELPSEIIEITLGPDDGEFINEDFLV